MSSTAEKLVFLQNGVFKRKEMTTGLQYYSDGFFNTLAIPETEGDYLLTIGENNALSWTQLGESLTSLNNSYFKSVTARQSPLPLKVRFHILSTTTPSVSSICLVAASTC